MKKAFKTIHSALKVMEIVMEDCKWWGETSQAFSMVLYKKRK